MIVKAAVPHLTFREWKFLDTHLIWIYEGKPRDSGQNWASNSYYTAWYLLDGSVEVQVGGQRAEAVKGQWLFLPPGASRRSFSEDARILSLNFDACWITGQLLFSFKLAIVFDESDTRNWQKLCWPMLQTVRRYFPEAYNQLALADTGFEQYAAIQGDFQRWLGRIWAPMQSQGASVHLPQHRDARALDMKRWIDALSVQHAFRLQDLAGAFGLSPVQVNRLFCADFGITPKRYFERRRLNYAQAALASSSQPMKEISYRTGFRHQSEFSTWFKQHKGRSPSAFREDEML
jgi:AraC-like DNA-binding protein